MGSEKEGIELFAATDGGVGTKDRVDEPGTVFQSRVVVENEANRLYAVEDTASVSDDAVHQFTTFADLSGALFVAVDGEVFEFVAPFDIRRRADFYIFEDAAVFHHRAGSHDTVAA